MFILKRKQDSEVTRVQLTTYIFLHVIINHLLNKGEKLSCDFVDFTKAFDYLVRDIIWFKSNSE